MSKGSYNMGLCSATKRRAYLMVLQDLRPLHEPLQILVPPPKVVPCGCRSGKRPVSARSIHCSGFTSPPSRDDWTQLISPSRPRDTQCHVDPQTQPQERLRAISPPPRTLTDGLRKMKLTLQVDGSSRFTARQSHVHGSAGAVELSKLLKERLERRYMADTEMMKKIKKGLAHQQKVYDFAVENYEKSWTSGEDVLVSKEGRVRKIPLLV